MLIIPLVIVVLVLLLGGGGTLILSFNWLYLSRTLSASRRVGVFPPKSIKYLVNLSILVAVFTFAFVTFFLIVRNLSPVSIP